MLYKTTHDLTAAQMEELKQAHLAELYDAVGLCPSYDDMADAGTTFTDEGMHEWYRGTSFTDGDFLCSMAA